MNKRLIFIAVFLLVFLTLQKGKNKMNTKTPGTGINWRKVKRENRFTPKDAEDAILYAAEKYGKEFARIFEKIYRHETAHFKSGQYVSTGTPGMEKGRWSGLAPYLGNDIDFSTHNDPKKGATDFVVWKRPLNSFVDFFHNFIRDKRGGNWAAWNTLNPERQQAYRERVLKVKNTIIN